MNLRLLAGAALGSVLLLACSENSSLPPVRAPAGHGSASTPPASQAATATTVNPGAASIGPASHEGDRAYAHVLALALEIGPRVAGSSGESRAVDYIAAQFASSGYAVEKTEFSYSGDRFRAATLKVSGRAIDAISMDGSAAGDVSAAAIFVGLADAAGLLGKDVGGKIAVADRGILTFAEKYEAARAAGAVGLVIINSSAGPLNGRTQPGARFPVLGVAGELGDAVRAAAIAGESFQLVGSGNTPGRALNVLARRAPGAACDVLVGGHYDSVPGVAGANDNASGTANVIELARAMAADGLDAGLCFAAFSAEESGLFGSAAMLEQLKAAGHPPKAMVNLDVTGIGSSVELIGDVNIVTGALATAKGLGIDARRSALPANSGSDHMTFEEAGVPSIWFFSGEFPSIHSPSDVVGDIDAVELDRVGDLAYAVLKDLVRQFARG